MLVYFKKINSRVLSQSSFPVASSGATCVVCASPLEVKMPMSIPTWNHTPKEMVYFMETPETLLKWMIYMVLWWLNGDFMVIKWCFHGYFSWNLIAFKSIGDVMVEKKITPFKPVHIHYSTIWQKITWEFLSSFFQPFFQRKSENEWKNGRKMEVFHQPKMVGKIKVFYCKFLQNFLDSIQDLGKRQEFAAKKQPEGVGIFLHPK